MPRYDENRGKNFDENRVGKHLVKSRKAARNGKRGEKEGGKWRKREGRKRKKDEKWVCFLYYKHFIVLHIFESQGKWFKK